MKPQPGAVPRLPHFVIVGSPRSGTSLVQRLCSEIQGVVVPPETHFYRAFTTACRPAFPLERDDLLKAMAEYLSLKTSRGLRLSADEVCSLLGGRCEDLGTLFAAILWVLVAPQHPAIVGEKTPMHLHHWRQIMNANPAVKMIAVVRDPRAVIASLLCTPFSSTRDVRVLAETWRQQQRILREASEAFPPGQFLWLRYEDVVAGYEASQLEVAGFLGVDNPVLRTVEMGALYHEWETWKGRVMAPPDASRVDAWKGEMTRREASTIADLAGPEMCGLGYAVSPDLEVADWCGLRAWQGRRWLFQRLQRARRAARARMRN